MKGRGYWLLAALTLVVVAGIITLAYRQRTERREANVSFARHMIQHHLQAVDMAKRLYDRTDEATLKFLAYDILTSQTEQVGQMRAWLNRWGEGWGGRGMSAEAAAAMGMASPQDVASLSSLPLDQAEAKFLQLMIRHHEGALVMVDGALQEGVEPQVRALAQQMRDVQQGEIRGMTELLEARGLTPPAPVEAGEHQH